MKILFISAVIIFTDQLSKLYIKGISLPFFGIRFDGLLPGHNYTALGDNLKLRLIENPGIGFGIYPGDEFKSAVTVVNIVLTAVLFFYLISTRKDLFSKRIGAALLFGGAAGNLIDRVFYGVLFDYAPLLYGNVVDFFNLSLSGVFPGNLIGNYVFNVADIAIVSGIILMMFSLSKAVKPEINSIAAENQE